MRKGRRRTFVVGLVVTGLVSIASLAYAAHSFIDVPDSHTFHNDIEWMKDSGITRGCNPPENTEYCPEDFTTRGQMAAFFHRAANSRTFDAGWLEGHPADDFVLKGEKVDDSDLLDGKDSTEFVQKGEKADDADNLDGKDSTEFLSSNVTLREFTEDSGLIDLGGTYQAFCEPGEVALSGGYEADFGLVDLADVELPIVGELPLVGDVLGLLDVQLGELDSALDGVTNVNVSASQPVVDGDLFGWEIQSTGNVLSNVTITVACAG